MEMKLQFLPSSGQFFKFYQIQEKNSKMKVKSTR